MVHARVHGDSVGVLVSDLVQRRVWFQVDEWAGTFFEAIRFAASTPPL